ncbi:hypothetical protein ACFQY5_09285 [Paeniroseomonas aquatica]|uniref:hypothetical protein n=1 Tax=Paeniroseomonas aquatica TaxID=373043 RepID=UPI00360DDAE1
MHRKGRGRRLGEPGFTQAPFPAPGFGEADLSNCEREQIHLAASIQPHGALLLIREADGVVVQASANAGTLLGLPEGVLGLPLAALGATWRSGSRRTSPSRCRPWPPRSAAGPAGPRPASTAPCTARPAAASSSSWSRPARPATAPLWWSACCRRCSALIRHGCSATRRRGCSGRSPATTG